MPREDGGTAALKQDNDEHLETAAEIESISLGEARTFAEIEHQANQLLDYISKLSSLADRTCHPPICESASAPRSEDTRQAEVVSLRRQLAESAASFEAQRRETERLTTTHRAEIRGLENRLLQRDNEINERETELKHLRAEITCLLKRLNETEETLKQTESGLHERIDPLKQEISSLRADLAKRDETINAKNNALRQIQMNHRAAITELEQRLRDMEAQLQSHETLIKEKDALIQATASKEAEIGKLIKRLSTECQDLSLELQEKTRLLKEVEGKKPEPAAEGNTWRRAIGRLQEEGI
jgi:chromosome segregation ATPase